MQEQELINRFIQLNQRFTGKLTLLKAYTIIQMLLKEKEKADIEYTEAANKAHELIGTGMGGITAQLKYEEQQKLHRKYEAQYFEDLYQAIAYSMYRKNIRIMNSSKVKTRQETEFSSTVHSMLTNLYSVGLDAKFSLLGEYVKKFENIALSISDIKVPREKRR